MVKQLLALALLGGGAYVLTRPGPSQRAFGDTGIPYAPDYNERAFGESGVPYLPGYFPEDSTDSQGGVLDMMLPDWSIFDMTKPRGIRNNNPGNIEYNGTQWWGLDEPPTDGRFARFVKPEYGIRALARTLETYYKSHGIDTVRGIINRWAPSFENDTGSYIAHVAQAVGVSPDTPIDVLAKRPQLITAIIQHENGEQPYSAALINQGIRMA